MKIKNKRNISKKRILTIMILLLLVLVWIIRFTSLNKQWPNPNLTTVPYGEKLSVGGLTFTVIDSKIGSDQEVALHYNKLVDLDELENTPNMKTEGWTQKILGVKIKVTNNTSEPIFFNFALLSLEYNEWYTNTDMFAFDFYNTEINNVEMNIKANSTIHAVVPYNLYKEHFANRVWNKVEELPFYIPILRYPEKIEFLVKS